MRIAFVGDVHGHAEELMRVLRRLEKHGVDEIVQVGDLVDRGPDSVGTVRIARTWTFQDRTGQEKKLKVVIGNHELNYLYYRRGWKMPFKNYIPKPKRTQIAEGLTDADIDWLETLPYFRRFKGEGYDVAAVHGGIAPWMKTPGWYGRDLSYIMAKAAYVGRFGDMMLSFGVKTKTFWADIYDGRFGHVYFGHMTHSKIYHYDHATATDLSKGGALGAVIFSNEDGDPRHTEVIEQYDTPPGTSEFAKKTIVTDPTPTPPMDPLSATSVMNYLTRKDPAFKAKIADRKRKERKVSSKVTYTTTHPSDQPTRRAIIVDDKRRFKTDHYEDTGHNPSM